MRKQRIIKFLMPVGVIFLGILGIMTMFATKPDPEKADEAPRPMTLFVEDVTEMDLELTVSTQGEVRSKVEIILMPQVSGRITYVSPAFTAGGAFEAGETLLKIDDSDYKLAVTRAEARVAEARLRLMQMEGSAEVASRQWDSEVGGKATPLALKVPQLEDARAKLRSAEADLEGANLNLERTNVSVPFSGRVRAKSADLGQNITMGTAVANLFSTEIAEIRLPLTDRQLTTLGLPLAYEAIPGEEPKVELTAQVGNEIHTWVGKIVRTNASVDSTTRMNYAVAEVDNPYDEGADGNMPLVVGLFVNAEITGRNVDRAQVIPRAALRSGNKVYVVDSDGSMHIREVAVLYSDVDKVIVSAGVIRGEQVVVSSVRSPSEGMKVEALKRGPNNNLASTEN